MPTNNTGNTTFMERLRNYYWTPGAPRGQNVLRALRGVVQGPASIPGALGSAVGGEAREAYNNYRARQEVGQMGPPIGGAPLPSWMAPNPVQTPGAPGASYNAWANPSNTGGVPLYDPATGMYTSPEGYGVVPMNSPTPMNTPGVQSMVGNNGDVIAQGDAAVGMAQGMSDEAFRAWGRMMNERMRPAMQ